MPSASRGSHALNPYRPGKQQKYSVLIWFSLKSSYVWALCFLLRTRDSFFCEILIHVLCLFLYYAVFLNTLCFLNHF